MSEEGNWHECVCDSDYEINDVFPYNIRRIGSDKIIKEFINKSTGYVHCKLNQVLYQKHRLIAQQFIPNDDETHKFFIDHLDHNRANNHISNLRWVSHKENMKNKSSYKGYKYIFLDELPDTAESLDSYNGHDLDGVYVDYEQQKLYLFNGVKYRELVACRCKGSIYYKVHDVENKQTPLYHKVLFG